MEKQTPLYSVHVESGAKMAPFAGYSMPIQYKDGLKSEHLATRKAAGLFDVSHMGTFYIQGKDALKNINYIFTNDFTNLEIGKARYTMLCNEEGNILDDLIIFRLDESVYMTVPNAANVATDYKWIVDHSFGDVEILDKSEETSILALQGPKALEILGKLMDPETIPEKAYAINTSAVVDGKEAYVSSTGYTGEEGVEIYLKNKDVESIWKALLEAGNDLGLVPVGLGARDTLRLEAGLTLYGNDIDDTTTPFEAGLGFFVNTDKEDMVGKEALIEAKNTTRSLVGLEATGRGILREGYDIYSGDKVVGQVTSGTKVPYLNKAIAMGYVANEYAEIGTELEVDVRGRRVAAVVVEKPFYKR